jgi:hypothetical protein
LALWKDFQRSGKANFESNIDWGDADIGNIK